MTLSLRDHSFRARRGRSQSGQAVTEYILVLVVVIGICLGSIYQFNDAFRAWAENYFGDYLACLLETGELPRIGGTGGASDSCNTMFKEFSLADGRPLNGSGVGPTDNEDSSNPSNKSRSEANPRGAGAADGGQSSGSSSFGTNRNFGSSFAANGRGRGGSAGQEGGGAGAKNKSYTGNTDTTALGGFSEYGQSGSRRRREGPGIFTAGKLDQVKRPKAKPTTSVALGRKEGRAPIIITRKPAAKDLAVEEKPMSFGDYFRYLLIIALILALVIVIGGQFLQISREME